MTVVVSTRRSDGTPVADRAVAVAVTVARTRDVAGAERVYEA